MPDTFATFNGSSLPELVAYNNTVTDGYFVIGIILTFVVVLFMGMTYYNRRSNDALTPLAVSFFIGTILCWLATGISGWVAPELSVTMTAVTVTLTILVYLENRGGSNV